MMLGGAAFFHPSFGSKGITLSSSLFRPKRAKRRYRHPWGISVGRTLMHKLLAGVISIATGSEIALRSRRSSREPAVVAPAVGPCGGRGPQQVWLPWRRLHHRLRLSCKRSQQDRPSSGPLYAGVSLSASAGLSADVTPVYEANDGIQPCCTPRCSEDSNQSPCEFPAQGILRFCLSP